MFDNELVMAAYTNGEDDFFYLAVLIVVKDVRKDKTWFVLFEAMFYNISDNCLFWRVSYSQTNV